MRSIRQRRFWIVCLPFISTPPLHFQAITRILVRRYIHVSKKTMRQGIVNEDDLLEIKQDISSLRLVYTIHALLTEFAQFVCITTLKVQR